MPVAQIPPGGPAGALRRGDDRPSPERWREVILGVGAPGKPGTASQHWRPFPARNKCRVKAHDSDSRVWSAQGEFPQMGTLLFSY